MASTDISQRNLYERIDLTAPPTAGAEVKNARRIVALNAVLAMIAAVLVYALIDGIDGWAHLVVLGGIVLTVVGTMLAVDPQRKG
ncbi:MAG: hypothetical protein WKF62_08050 [Solirubrobacterales bacterium]|nr:hypothetical protein [Actinomycetota bacterium]